jgi:hypothetical protein
MAWRRDRFSATGGHAAAHDEIGSCAEFFDEGLDLAEVVAAVGLAHDEVFSLGGLHAVAKGVAVAFFGNIHNPRAELAGDVLRSVGAAVVGDEDFALDSRRGESALRGGNAVGQRLRLVQAGHDDGDLRHGWWLQV